MYNRSSAEFEDSTESCRITLKKDEDVEWVEKGWVQGLT